MNSATTCSIILPCYNPQQHWAGRVIDQYRAISARLNVPVHIIIVNDGSTTGITEVDIETLKKAIPGLSIEQHDVNRGKGYALRRGVALADTDIIIYTDIDFPYSVESVGAIFDALDKEGYDIAVGIKNKDYYTHVPVLRRYISRLLRMCTGLIFRIPVTDTQCGLKGFNAEAKQVFLSTTIDRYMFDLEFIRNTAKTTYKIKPVEVELNKDVVFRKMNYRLLFTEAINFARLIFSRK